MVIALPDDPHRDYGEIKTRMDVLLVGRGSLYESSPYLYEKRKK